MPRTRMLSRWLPRAVPERYFCNSPPRSLEFAVPCRPFALSGPGRLPSIINVSMTGALAKRWPAGQSH